MDIPLFGPTYLSLCVGTNACETVWESLCHVYKLFSAYFHNLE